MITINVGALVERAAAQIAHLGYELVVVGEMRSAVNTTVASMACVGYVISELSSSHDVASRQCLVDRPVREDCSRRLARELA